MRCNFYDLRWPPLAIIYMMAKEPLDCDPSLTLDNITKHLCEAEVSDKDLIVLHVNARIMSKNLDCIREIIQHMPTIQLRWPSGKSVRIGSCRLRFDSASSQTNDFKIGIHSLTLSIEGRV